MLEARRYEVAECKTNWGQDGAAGQLKGLESAERLAAAESAAAREAAIGPAEVPVTLLDAAVLAADF